MNATRLFALTRKECLQIARDRSILIIGFLLPVMLILIFGFGLSMDIQHVRTGLVSTSLFDPGLPTVRAITDGREVLEVKFDRYMPDFVSALLHGLPAERSAISKYVLCRRFEPLDTF